jgi:transaldolase/glucose-6-phosphate isomerase
MTRLHERAELGQSVWLDSLRHFLITSGDLTRMIDQGVMGLTSNMAQLEKAIAGSADYDEEIRRMVSEGKSTEEIGEALILQDIRLAADLFRPLHERTNGAEGYVSLEVAPSLAHDAEGTVSEAKRLVKRIERPNVMIKVPATEAGISATEALIALGISVDATLIFSVARCEAVAAAYLGGLEQRAAAGGDLSRVASVASIFMGPLDTAADRALEAAGETGLERKSAVAVAVKAHARFQELFGDERFERLKMKGARRQRLLFCGTAVRNPLHADTLYADELAGPDTALAMPPATLQAFMGHGRTGPALQGRVEEAGRHLALLAERGIDLEAIAAKLQEEGIGGLMKSFVCLMAAIEEKRERVLAGWHRMTAELGPYQNGVEDALAAIRDEQVIHRLWAHDHRIWKPDPKEITNRLGWLHSVEVMQENLEGVRALADAVRQDGYTHALLLGMGGSSLAPEVFRKTFGVRKGFLDLAVLDSTDPGAVLRSSRSLDPARTLYIVSTKSGGTVETLSLFKYFYNQALGALGREEAGRRFAAVTDPGSTLADLARELGFRAAFLNDPNIGGRYSALSYFGLVPAALVGINLDMLLDRAMAMVCNCEGCNCPVGGDNLGALLGAVMGRLAGAGRDKLTLFSSPAIASFGHWVEQLIAESTGKEGRGILPVLGDRSAPPEAYGDDRLLVDLSLEDDPSAAGSRALQDAGHPLVRIRLKDLYDLGGQFFLFEMATAVAGALMGINPFDQPNVESAKLRAREMVDAYRREGALPEPAPALEAEGMKVFCDVEAKSPGEALGTFLEQAGQGAYVAVQAYVQPAEEMDEALGRLRARLEQRTRLAVTTGYGPRFLHSTGQLHKGDAGRGLFIQITDDPVEDAPIPDEAGSEASSMSFGVLKKAQALGDRQALLDAGRRVIRFHLGAEALQGVRKLSEMLE